jgi:hypothetical protein
MVLAVVAVEADKFHRKGKHFHQALMMQLLAVVVAVQQHLAILTLEQVAVAEEQLL